MTPERAPEQVPEQVPAPYTPRPRSQRHLLDLDNPQPRRADPMSLSTVQMWVLSTLAVTTILHMSAGLVLAAMYVGDCRPDAQVGLLVIAGLFGVMSVAAARAIHRKKLLSTWLVLGWVPTLVGAWLVFWR